MQENQFIYAIPSYNRAGKQKTVELLAGIGIKKERIFVFVQTAEDKEAYTKAIGDKAKIILKPAKRGVEARNNILNELAEQHNILMLDDDIKAIGVLKGEEIRAIDSAREMDGTFEKCFGTCKKAGASVFGIYPVYNAFFLSRTISTLSPINTVFGFAKGFKLRYNEDYDTKEDAELCARLLSFRKRILRFNFIAVDADHRKTKDGYIDDWHQEENIRCVRKLVFEYPEIYKPQKDKPWEVRSLVKDSKIILSGGKKR